MTRQCKKGERKLHINEHTVPVTYLSTNESILPKIFWILIFVKSTRSIAEEIHFKIISTCLSNNTLTSL